MASRTCHLNAKIVIYSSLNSPHIHLIFYIYSTFLLGSLLPGRWPIDMTFLHYCHFHFSPILGRLGISATLGLCQSHLMLLSLRSRSLKLKLPLTSYPTYPFFYFIGLVAWPQLPCTFFYAFSLVVGLLMAVIVLLCPLPGPL